MPLEAHEVSGKRLAERGYVLRQYNYLCYVTSRRSALEKRIEQGREHGYEVAARASFSRSEVVILEKLAD